ncbi:AraC family transcriptional regulator [Vibrio lamellibrachiae]|uniref:helix-turn-helix domain-containing protein n=1 Tax=Vibrio lamellibrachiae TaxID=2910253 RepID=UPI003D09689F
MIQPKLHLTANKAWFAMLESALVKSNVDIEEAFLGKENIKRLKKSDHIDVTEFKQAILRATEMGDSATIARHCAEEFDPIAFGPAGIALSTAPTLRSFLKLYSELYVHFLPSIRIIHKPVPHGVELWLINPEMYNNEEDTAYQLQLIYSMVMINFIRHCVSSSEFTFIYKLISWYYPDQLRKDFEQQYNIKIETGSDFRRICFDDKYLDLPLKNSNASVHYAMTSLAYEQRAQIEKRSLLPQIYTIFESHDIAAISLDMTAKHLFLSRRTFTRRLALEEVSFNQIFERYKLEKALTLLNEQQDITTIALELGFRNLSSFSRAFKRWTGKSPSIVLAHR